MRSLAPLLLTVALAAPASAVIIDSGDGTGNTSAPSPDPGWGHVATRGGLTAVHLEGPWMITANHVGAGNVVLGGVPYSVVPGSAVRLDNGDGTFADLLMFAVAPTPPLAPLVIASSTPSNGASLILAGNGRNRGAATSWDPNGGPPPGPLHGYEWALGRTLRWGTNFVESFPIGRVFDTEVFGSIFDLGDSPHEAQAANGDSGGAAFAWDGSQWQLAGVMIATTVYDGQPAETSLEGQTTYAADLSFYRDQILDVVEMPEPTGAWPAGAVLVGALARRRRACAAASAVDCGRRGDQWPIPRFASAASRTSA